MNEQVVDVPVSPAGFCAREFLVPRDSRRNSATSTSDVEVFATLQFVLSQRSESQRCTLLQGHMQHVRASDAGISSSISL